AMTAADDAHGSDRWQAALEQVRCIAQQYARHQHLDQDGHEAAGHILAQARANPGLLALAYVDAVDTSAQTKDPHDRRRAWSSATLILTAWPRKGPPSSEPSSEQFGYA
ncbi:MAG: hypothetical protein ACRDYA_21045, partial [Egibacteraceae bacterium]